MGLRKVGARLSNNSAQEVLNMSSTLVQLLAVVDALDALV
jgi:hypothetical protein